VKTGRKKRYRIDRVQEKVGFALRRTEGPWERVPRLLSLKAFGTEVKRGENKKMGVSLRGTPSGKTQVSLHRNIFQTFPDRGSTCLSRFNIMREKKRRAVHLLLITFTREKNGNGGRVLRKGFFRDDSTGPGIVKCGPAGVNVFCTSYCGY